MSGTRFVVTFWNGDLNRCLGVYDTTQAAMGAVLYDVLDSYGEEGAPEFKVKVTGDSGYDSFYDINVTFHKEGEGYKFDYTDQYRVFFLRSDESSEGGGSCSGKDV